MRNPTLVSQRTASSGFTLLEVLIGLGVSLFVGSAVFTALSQVMVQAAQDETNHELRNDLVLTLSQIQRDIRIATNVYPKAGSHSTSATTLVLRQPVTDFNNDIQEDEFQFVTYTVVWGSGNSAGKLTREVWTTEESTQPVETRVLNENIVALGFLYGGKKITQVTNLTPILDVEVVLVSGRETGLTLQGQAAYSISSLAELSVIGDLLDYGMEFPTLRFYLDNMNRYNVDIIVAASMGSAQLRNKKALGLKTIQPPATASS